MKINEVTQPSDQRLFEDINKTNDTGYATADLVKIVRQHQSGEWSGPMTADEVMEHLRKLAGASKV
jgi:hypothetical protein